MVKKIIIVAVALVTALASLVSCSFDGGEHVIEMNDVSVDSIDVSVSDSSRIFSMNDSYISEALFKYIYMYVKKDLMDHYARYESLGYNVTGDANIKVGDTEAFWGCTQSKKEDGTVVTLKDNVYKNAVDIAKNVIALEKLAEDYKFIYPDDYNKKLEAAIFSDVETYGDAYLDLTVEFADEDSVVFDWAKARREVYLASKGITAEEWERVFFMYRSVLSSGIRNHLEFVGAIEPDSDESIRLEAEKYLKEQLENYLKDNVKVDILFYQYDEKKETKEASGEDSEQPSSDETSAETSEDVEKLTNEQLLEKCKGIVSGLKDGSLSFAEEKKSATAGDENQILPKDSMVQYFNEDAKEGKQGDVKLVDTDYGVYIIIYKDLTETDFGRTTTPTEDELKSFKEMSLDKKLNELLKVYVEAVSVDEEALAKYKSPWNIK